MFYLKFVQASHSKFVWAQFPSMCERLVGSFYRCGETVNWANRRATCTKWDGLRMFAYPILDRLQLYFTVWHLVRHHSFQNKTESKLCFCLGFYCNVIKPQSTMLIDLKPNVFCLRIARSLCRDLPPKRAESHLRDLWGIKSGTAPTKPHTTALSLFCLSYPIHVSPCYHKWFYSQPQWIVEGSCIIFPYQCVLNYTAVIWVWVSARH